MRKRLIRTASLMIVVPSAVALILWRQLVPFSLGFILFPLFALSMIGVVLLIIALVLPSDRELSSNPENVNANSNVKEKHE